MWREAPCIFPPHQSISSSLLLFSWPHSARWSGQAWWERSSLQYCTCTVQYSTLQYSIVQYSTPQYSTIQYSVICQIVLYSLGIAFPHNCWLEMWILCISWKEEIWLWQNGSKLADSDSWQLYPITPLDSASFNLPTYHPTLLVSTRFYLSPTCLSLQLLCLTCPCSHATGCSL